MYSKSGDPDHTPASDLSSYCLPISYKKDTRLICGYILFGISIYVHPLQQMFGRVGAYAQACPSYRCPPMRFMYEAKPRVLVNQL